jgi:xanthine dehydrogenase YagS FAD-binding subunit
MATIGGNLLQRPRCWYFRNQYFACWLKGGADCPAREGENQLHALFGGGPCYAVHPSDLAAALVALEATVQLRGPQGERTLPLREFFALPTAERRQETIIAPDELLLALHLPALPAATRSTYRKAMDRKVWAFALVGVAAVLRIDEGKIAAARLVLSGIAPIPWRLTAAEQVLTGAAATEATITAAIAAGLQAAAPLRQNGYKVPLAQGLMQQALHSLIGADALPQR